MKHGLHGHGLAILDIETTGLRAGHHEILEVSILLVDSLVGLSTKSETYPGVLKTWFFRPIHPDRIDPGALQCNGYTPDDWYAAPAPLSPVGLDAYREIVDLCQDRVIVGHNVRFDLEFLRDHLITYGYSRSAGRARAALSMPRIRAEIDTIPIAYATLGGQLERLSLDHIRERLPHLERGESHTSSGDVLTLAAMLCHCLGSSGTETA